MTGARRPQVVFVAGAHTEIGKTHAACGLLQAARDEGLMVEVLKPVVSGFDHAEWAQSDPGRLLAAAGRSLSTSELDRMAPWRFERPLAPPMAAEEEGRPLPFSDIVDFCRGRIEESRADLFVVEGVGGLMSPIAEDATSLDLLEGLAGWSLLVAGTYLGSVSHTLTALEVLRARGLAPAAIVVSEDADPAAPDFMATVALLTRFAGETPVLPARRAAGYGWAGLALKVLRG